MNSFDVFFSRLSKHHEPFGWQQELAGILDCGNRLIRIPTGFGKTFGVLSVWAWHRLHRQEDLWPRRLVWCLPMRVLVEQTAQEASDCLERLGLLWRYGTEHVDKVGVHLLMGGADSGDWHLYPEHSAVLIGTQDMLLSRALNRGYACPRARWPMEFGLLNQDCLWVMDEVQLMDVGLATSAQLQAFRHEDASRSFRPCFSWWMSATLQRAWLEKSPDTSVLVMDVPDTRIAPESRTGHLWNDVAKPCKIEVLKNAKGLARRVSDLHIQAERGSAGPTLVVVNTVDRAIDTAKALKSDKRIQGTDIRLVHSRYRPAERASWREDFLNRPACAPGTDRIIVATQVVEAGVNVSAALLVTELAPWASLVQRFGRCARWGGDAQVLVADFSHKNDKAAAPYSKDELDAARRALESLPNVAPLHLEAFEEANSELIPLLYPFEPTHLLLRHELDELFDTTPDLSGADIDISRFIRSGEERDVQVFWAEVPEIPPSDLRPSREALCAVPFLKARDWLCGKETSSAKAPRLKQGMHAWVWDWLEGRWRKAERRDLYPGQTVLVASECGGYDPNWGWSAGSSATVEPVTMPSPSAAERADAGQDDESLSAYQWQTIAVHGRETGRLVRDMARTLNLDAFDLLEMAGRLHDTGKAHPAFNGSIVGEDRPARDDLAKAPDQAWLPVKKLYPMPDGSRRPGFRHELASTLALFAVLQRHDPDHPALLGPWRGLLEQAGFKPAPKSTSETPPTPLEREVLALEAAHFDLLAYLICAHHGKLRVAWHTCPADQKVADETLRIRGLRQGDELPALTMFSGDDTQQIFPAARLDLSPAAAGLSPRTGQGWTDRVLGLLRTHGPFALAWLEALLRAADQRTSRRSDIIDELLNEKVLP